MKLDELIKILNLSWTKETSFDKDNWTVDNPSLGQCAITALIVNDFLGGKIMRCMCGNTSHYYNIVNDKLIDLTKEQFIDIIPDYEHGEERTREYLLSNRHTLERYKLLLKNVKTNFKKYGEYEYRLLDCSANEYTSKIPGTIGGNKALKIYGTLDCKSALRYIKIGKYKPNRVFFPNEETAIAAGYRPCGVCKKEELPSIYIIQLIFNLLWSFIFFKFKWFIVAFIWIIILFFMVLKMIKEFREIDKTAGNLQIPYLIWLVVAAILNLMYII